jgi:16S rRNA (uracil1498-N3)-methyltransferase
MTLQRYFINREDWTEGSVLIKGEDAHHILRVMRYTVGDQIICNQPEGKAAVCVISETEKNKVVAKIENDLHVSTELPVHVTIAQGLPKGDKIDLILQKGTELGAHAFIPFQAERSVVVWDDKKIEKKLKRFRKIIKEASEQSQRNMLPEVTAPMDLQDLIEESKTYQVKIFAYEEEAKVGDPHSFGEKVKKLVEGDRVLLAVGPEGGFSRKEASLLQEQGFQPVRLGPRILRTETAPLYALASISYHFEES